MGDEEPRRRFWLRIDPSELALEIISIVIAIVLATAVGQIIANYQADARTREALSQIRQEVAHDDVTLRGVQPLHQRVLSAFMQTIRRTDGEQLDFDGFSRAFGRAALEASGLAYALLRNGWINSRIVIPAVCYLGATVLLPPVVPEMPLQASPVANHDAAHHRPTTHRRLIIYQGTGTSNAAASAKVRTTTPRCCAPEPRAIRSHSCPRASEGPPEEVASGETPLSTPRNRSRYLRAYHSMTLGWVFTASCCRKIFGFALNTSTGM